MVKTSSCPNPEKFDDLRANRLSCEEASDLRLHLASCPRCQALLHTETAMSEKPPSPTRIAEKPAPSQEPPQEQNFDLAHPKYPFLSPPKQLGDLGWMDGHRILGILGEGGMSIVFDAEDDLLHRRVALKVLRPNLVDPLMRERFLREGRVLAAMPHDHIVAVYQVGEHQGVPYLTMERLEGQSLEDRLKRDKWLALGEALQITLEAAEGLQVAHERNLVHRDIKPSNIWLESRGGRSPQGTVGEKATRVKIIDFGIVRVPQQDEGLTRVGQVLGTPLFMAPEQAAGEPLDGRADLYSLGCVLFQMVTGQQPFSGASSDTMLLLRSVMRGEIPKVTDLAPQLNPAVAELIHDLLARDPKQRPADANALIARLRRLETEEQQTCLLPPSSSPLQKPGSLARQPRMFAIALGAFFVFLALVVGVGAVVLRLLSLHPHHPPQLDPVAVGILHSQTGFMSLHEKPIIQATELAIEEINAAGGVLGRKIIIHIEDGQSREEIFAAKAKTLLEEKKVEALFGCWTSSSRKRVLEQCESAEKFLFYPAAYEGLESSTNVVYLGGTPNQWLTPLAQWAIKDKGKKNIYLVGSEYVFSYAVHDMLRKEIERKGGKIAGERFLLIGDPNIRQVIDDILLTKPDLIINTIDGQDNLGFFRQLRGAKITPKTIPTVWFNISESELGSFEIDQMIGDFTVANYFESISRPENIAFIERFRKSYGRSERVSDPMATAYAGVHLWKEAVTKAGTFDTEALRQILPTISVSGPMGMLRLADNRHAYRRTYIGEVSRTLNGDSLPAEELLLANFKIVWRSPDAIPPRPYPTWKSVEDWEVFLEGLRAKFGNRWEKRFGDVP
jgi:urea transport system substrate-binding protein